MQDPNKLQLEIDIKHLIIESLALEDIEVEDIDTQQALFNGGLELDSIDALELGVALKNKYQISIKNENEEDIQKQLSIDLRIFEDYNILFIILGIWREKNRLSP